MYNFMAKLCAMQHVLAHRPARGCMLQTTGAGCVGTAPVAARPPLAHAVAPSPLGAARVPHPHPAAHTAAPALRLPEACRLRRRVRVPARLHRSCTQAACPAAPRLPPAAAAAPAALDCSRGPRPAAAAPLTAPLAAPPAAAGQCQSACLLHHRRAHPPCHMYGKTCAKKRCATCARCMQGERGGCLPHAYIAAGDDKAESG